MVIPLAGQQRWLFAGSALLTVVYLLLAAREFAASHYAFRPDLPSLERAVRLTPENADYHHRLGRYFAFVDANPQSALDNYQAATRLNPHQARYWFDLASAYQVLGDTSNQTWALEHAIETDPTTPDVAWEAANFYLVRGDNEKALREFHVVLENEPSLAALAIQFCWRINPDVDMLLRDVVPPRSTAYIAFLSLLMTRQETAATAKVWAAMSE